MVPAGRRASSIHALVAIYQQCRLVHLGVQCFKAFTAISSIQWLRPILTCSAATMAGRQWIVKVVDCPAYLPSH